MNDFKLQDIPECLRNDIEINQDLVMTNINCLKDLGVSNYLEIFKHYYYMFLMDNSNFMNIFNKYERKDLVDKLEKNMAIIEHL